MLADRVDLFLPDVQYMTEAAYVRCDFKLSYPWFIHATESSQQDKRTLHSCHSLDANRIGSAGHNAERFPHHCTHHARILMAKAAIVSLCDRYFFRVLSAAEFHKQPGRRARLQAFSIGTACMQQGMPFST
jgi:hypothetical protein